MYIMLLVIGKHLCELVIDHSEKCRKNTEFFVALIYTQSKIWGAVGVMLGGGSAGGGVRWSLSSQIYVSVKRTKIRKLAGRWIQVYTEQGCRSRRGLDVKAQKELAWLERRIHRLVSTINKYLLRSTILYRMGKTMDWQRWLKRPGFLCSSRCGWAIRWEQDQVCAWESWEPESRSAKPQLTMQPHNMKGGEHKKRRGQTKS